MSKEAEARWALLLPLREHLLAVARRRCSSEEDAEDCVHEAMLRVAQFDGLDPERAGALLTSVTVRMAMDMHRARARARRHLPRLVSVAAQHQAPDEALLDSDEARWLAAQVERLPDRERDVLLERAAGYSVGESAARLSLSYKAVESAFTRARGRMRAWAGAAVLLAAEYLRRLRQRPNTGLAASMVMVSAGVLLITSFQRHPTQAAERPQASTATSHGLWLDAVPRAHLQAAAVAPHAGMSQPRPTRAPTTPPATPTPGVPHKLILGQDVPGTVKKNAITVQFGLGISLPDLPILP